MTSPNVETRSYRIVELLGVGGYGKVYRARMEGAAGFSKDVALKLLTDKNPPEDVIQRFRDESRILGLIRDRAIVGVEPPTQLGGRWAVVMEYVPGASCQRLLKARGPFPPRVALQIVEEVARSLDHVYRQVGPDGQELQLVHRDLKPGNLQLTRAGEVKILDFGVARARFERREAATTRSIQGTYGYIAPERLQGVDTPAGDVYSLGMVLYKLVTNGPSDPKGLQAALETATGDLRRVLQLARRMCAPEPQDRPTGREVEDLAAEISRGLDGPDLRRWAEEHVPERMGSEEDELVGKLLTSTLQIREPSQDITRGGGRAGLVLLASITGVNLLLVIGGVVAVALAVVAVVVIGRTTGREAVPVPVVQVPPIAEPAPEPLPAPVPSPEPAPGPEVAPTAPRPDPEPVAPAVATFPLDIGSAPLGAEVFLDGRRIGKTPLFGYAVPAGKHTLELRAAGQTGRTTIDVGRRKPTRYVWKGGDEWEVLY